MKLILTLALGALIVGPAFAGPNSMVLTQRNSTDTGNLTRVMTTPTSLSMLSYDPLANLPGYTTLSAVATSGSYGDLTGRPTFATVATSGQFSDLLGKPTTLSGYGITDGVSSSTLTTTLAGYVTSSALTTTLGSYATTSALTTGLAGKFNTPAGTTAQYVRGDGTLATLPASGSGTVTSVAVSSSTLSVSGSPVTTSGTITVNTIARSFAYPTRALSTCFQISSTRDAQVSYGVDISTTVTLGGSPQGTVFLRTYTNSSCTTGQQTVISSTAGQPTTLSVTVGQQVIGTANLSGVIPAGVWVQLEPVNTSGTPTFTARQGQEVQL